MHLKVLSTKCWLFHCGPVFCLLLGVSSDYAQPFTGQVTEVTCPVIGWAQLELTPNKRQKMGPGLNVTRSKYSMSAMELLLLIPNQLNNYCGTAEINRRPHKTVSSEHDKTPSLIVTWQQRGDPFCQALSCPRILSKTDWNVNCQGPTWRNNKTTFKQGSLLIVVGFKSERSPN